MRSTTYFELSSATGTLSDEFYKAMTRWCTGKQDNQLRVECNLIARRYREALDAQISYLNSLESSAEIDEAIAKVTNYKNLLEKDLKVLATY